MAIRVIQWSTGNVGHYALRAILNITGDGLFNMNRVHAPVGFHIDRLFPPLPIFSEIQERGNISDEEMYRVFNMGLGFCFVVPQEEVPHALTVLGRFPMEATVIGTATADAEKKIVIPGLNLVGKDGRFFPA